MGVTIHFRGSLNKKNQVHELMDEVQDICESMDWDYNLMDEDWDIEPGLEFGEGDGDGISLDGHAGLKGIMFRPDSDCDVIALTFTKEGYLNSLLNIAMGHVKMDGELPWIFAKTQFAGAEVHVSVVKLLKYIKQKYIGDLEVQDDGNYWESGDYGEVEVRMQIINQAMNAIEKSLAELKQADFENMSKDAIMKKIEDAVKDLSEDAGVEVKILRIDKVFEEKGINLDLDLDDLGVDDVNLN